MTEQTSRLAIIIDSSGAEKQADNLATALVKMTRWRPCSYERWQGDKGYGRRKAGSI